ncbi:hypothetical protein ElyMa_006960200 [Elysia marginata]|uniref:Uncharacterized protein n=1 Tax=Elysia marginata TaxID=1093978 RepID=A0AAV4JLZ2_9GAST|nr:hypothetical protein ElyMa_006960200 [Elysia marginata]
MFNLLIKVLGNLRLIKLGAHFRNSLLLLSPLGAGLLLNLGMFDRLCLAVRYSLRDREMRGSIPGRVKPRTLKLVLAADPPSVWHYGFSAMSGRAGVRIM